jgi:hypothetical protein
MALRIECGLLLMRMRGDGTREFGGAGEQS